MKLRAQTKKPITLTPIRPNAGLTADYRKELDKLIEEMHDSLVYWVGASYKANEPEIAQDASPAKALQSAMQKLFARLRKKFYSKAPWLAKRFATKAMQRVDKAFEASLNAKGMEVTFKMTAAQNDVLQATIQQQVGLIKSIADQHLTQVQGMVMRSVQSGRDVKTLTEELQKQFGVTKRRAKFIALSQNNIATAALTKTRQKELGLGAKWLHSHAGREPRPTHLELNGKPYDISKGAWDKDANGKGKGAFVYPGELPRCRCVSVSVIPGFE